MKSKNRILGLSAAMLSLLTSCGIGGNRPNYIEYQGPDFSLVNFDESTNVTIKFAHSMGTKLKTMTEKYIEVFKEQYPNVKVELQSNGNYSDLLSNVSKEIPADNAPTMAFCYPDHVATYDQGFLGSNVLQLSNGNGKALLDLEDKSFLKSFVSEFVEEGQKYDQAGTTFSMPWAKSTEVMFYNADVFTALGITPPKYWFNPDNKYDLNSVEGVCYKLKAEYPTSHPLGYDSEDNMFITLCKQFGIKYTELTDEGPALYFRNTNTELKTLMEKLKEMYDAGLFITKGLSESGSYTSTLFCDQECFMTIGSTGGTSYNIPSSESKKGVFNVKAANMPQQGLLDSKKYGFGQILQGPSICLFNTPNNTPVQLRAAWEFYKVSMDAKLSVDYSIQSGYEPVRTTCFDEGSEAYLYREAELKKIDSIYTEVKETSLKAKEDGYFFVTDVFVGSATARSQCGGALCNYLTGSKTFDQAFNDAINNTVIDML